MKKLVSLLLALVMVLGVVPIGVVADGLERSAAPAEVSSAACGMADFALTQEGKTGSNYSSLGVSFDWCVWFTTYCASNNGLCGTTSDYTGNVFPPIESGTWEPNNWAATGVTYQINWFANNNKGTYYHFGVLDSRISSNSNLVSTSRSSFTPEEGDLIYFDWEHDGKYNHVAIVYNYDPSTGTVYYIGGNQGNNSSWQTRVVSRVAISASSADIVGYMEPRYPDNNTSTREYVYSANGSDFTSSSSLATKLNNVFNGSVQLFSNTSATYPLGTSLDNSFQYYIANGSYSGWQCYIYGNAVYYYLFGEVPYHGSSSYAHSAVVMSNVESASYSNFTNAGVRVGAYVRTTSNSDGSYNGNYGHSMIVLSYDESYIYTLEGNANGNGLVIINKRTWANFNSANLSSRRIAHIVQPTTAYYESIGEYGANAAPFGVADAIEGGTNSIHIRGWAFDSDCKTQSLPIEVYIGGEYVQSITANTYRPDVNAAYNGVGEYHGYDAYIATSKTGVQNVAIYALDVDSSGNYSGNQNMNKLIGEAVVTLENGADFYLTDADLKTAIALSEGGDGLCDNNYMYLGVSAFSRMYSLHFLVDYPEEFVSITDYSKTFAGGLIDLITASIANNTQTSDSFNASCDITYVGQTGGTPVGEPGNMYANGGCWNTSWSFGGVQVGGNFIRLSIRLDKVPLVSDCEQDSSGYYLPVPLTLLEFTQSEMKEGGYYGASVNYCLPENNADWLTATAGKIYVTPVDHYHSLQFVPAANPTCTQNGHIGYYFCAGCGKCFTDAAGENEITLASTVIPALGHTFVDEDVPATCISYAGVRHTCSVCGYSYIDYVGEWSDWSTEYPVGIDEDRIETGTEYRYRDYVTTTSYDTSMSGWDRIGSEWVQNGSGTVNYVQTWPSGFDTNHNLYGTYHNTPVTATETETNKTVINSNGVMGYIYWHWCRGDYTSGPINRQLRPYYTSEFDTFHAFYSTSTPTDGHLDSYTDPVIGTLYYYEFSNSSCCTDTYWYYAFPVYRQTYTTYRNLFTYGQWGEWSNWSPEPVEATDTREVETRTVYRYITGEYGPHEWDEGVVTIEPTIYTEGEMTYTCVHCHETYTEAIPVLISCTVTFKDWDGTVLKTQQVEYGGAASAPADPSREGYTFTGWDVDFSCVTSDLIVTAQYEQNVQPTDPPIPSDAPKIMVESKTAVAGNTVAVAVKLENNPGIVSMKLRLSYDGRLTLTSVEDTGLLPGKMHAPSLTNPYLLVWENDTASSNYTVNGTIAILTFEIPEGTDAGDYSVNISYDADNYDIFNFDLDSVDFAVINGKITVLDVLIGDVNSDGRVNSMDRALLGRYLAGWASVPASMINMAAADVNLDGSVNPKDRAILGRHLAGWAGYEELPYTAKSAEIVPAPAKTGGDAPTITVSNVTAQPGETVTVDVSLDNNPGVISMMLRLAYDPALTLISVEDTGVMPGREHDLTNFINPYILYWANETASSNIAANGVIARLTFRLADDAAPGLYPITVSYDNGNYDIFDYDFVPVDFEVVNGGVTSVLLGDVNGDGELTFADVSALSGFALGLSDTELPLAVADINGDGEITFADVGALYAIILG